MSTPLRNDQGLSRREEMTVSTAAMADVPWGVAGAAGVVVTGADLAVHLMGGHLGLGSSLSAGTVALFAVAGGSVVVRNRATAPRAGPAATRGASPCCQAWPPRRSSSCSR